MMYYTALQSDKSKEILAKLCWNVEKKEFIEAHKTTEKPH